MEHTAVAKLGDSSDRDISPLPRHFHGAEATQNCSMLAKAGPQASSSRTVMLLLAFHHSCTLPGPEVATRDFWLHSSQH